MVSVQEEVVVAEPPLLEGKSLSRSVWHVSQTLCGLRFGPDKTVLAQQSAQNILQQCLHLCLRLVTLNWALHPAQSLKSSSCWHRTSMRPLPLPPSPSPPLLPRWLAFWLSSICSDWISFTRSSWTDKLFLASFFNEAIWFCSSAFSSFCRRISNSFCSLRCFNVSTSVCPFSLISKSCCLNSCFSASASIRTFFKSLI